MAEKTFVVTGVDESATLWQRVPEAMLEATEVHDALVRKFVGQHAGSEVRRGSNEGFVIGFANEAAAVRFCFALSGALLGADWPAELLESPAAAIVRGPKRDVLLRGLRVNMGVHRGPTIERKDPATGKTELFGPAIGRAAELASLARAGQILVEQDLAARIGELPHVARPLPVDPSIVELLPETLAERPFPADSGERTAKTNLTKDRTPFVGRERDIDSLYRLIAETPSAITLLGPGGIGKTRLARQFATLTIAEYGLEGGVWFCDLQSARTREDIVRVVGAALEIPLDQGGSNEEIIDRIGEILERRGSTLVVLDNFEQLDSTSAKVVARWSEQAPETRFIVTSRSRLGIEGEACLEVHPMTNEDALELFLMRARSAGTTPSEQGTEGEAIRDIVEKLERIPLAIELAAARTRVLPPAVLRDRLASGLDVLRAPGAAGKHSTLRATVRWSWDLLGPEEQAALSQMSVFRGGFTLEAAEAVISLGTPESPATMRPVDALEALVEKSLVRTYEAEKAEVEPRFGLYQSILEFASERLSASGTKAQAYARHATYFLKAGGVWASGLAFHTEPKNLEILAQEIDNLTAVVERMLESDPIRGVEAALILDEIINVRGPLEPHAALLTRAAQAAEKAGDNDKFARVRLARARCYIGLGRFHDGNTECELALSVHPSRRIEGMIYSSLGAIQRFRGHVDLARKSHEKAYAALTECDAPADLGQLLGRAALVDHGEGDLAKARELYERALALHRETGRERYEAIDLANFGLLEMERNEPERARAHFERAIEIHRRLGLKRYEAIATGHLALAEHEASRLTQARMNCERAIDLHRDVGDRRFEGLLSIQKGFLAYEEGDLDEAQELFLGAADLGDKAGDAILAVFGTVSLAVLHATVGKKEVARATLTSAKLRLAGEYGPWTLDNIGALGVIIGISTPDEAEAERKAILESREHPLPKNDDDDDEPPFAYRMIETRFGMRILRRALAVRAARAKDLGVELERAETSLEVGPDGQWFRPPRGQRVDLGRRYVLRRLLMTLVEMQEAGRGAILTVDGALGAGWPGETLGRKAAANRVRVAIATLRKLGLRRLLLTHGEGYKLDPEVPIVRSN